MIKNLLIVLFLSTIAVHIQAQSPAPSCRTPDSEDGYCVRLRACPELHTIPKSFLRRSQCGNQREFVVLIYRLLFAVTTTAVIHGDFSVTTTKAPRKPTRILSNRISAEKCDDYADFAFNKTYMTRISAPDIVGRTSTCAAYALYLIWPTGGTTALRREFPHMALIGFFYDSEIHWECGGTLISERFVLSAEHCSSTEKTGPAKYIRLGEHNIALTFDAIHMDFDIIETISHAIASPRTFNDIVLFKVDRDVQFNHAIRPACLPQQLDVQRDVIAAGWGSVPGGQNSDTLLKVYLTTFSLDEWNGTYIGQLYNKDYDEASMVFAGANVKPFHLCNGNLGGPLQIFDSSRNHHCTYIVVGVASAGTTCGHTGSPGIYTNVYSHLDWIEQTVWPNQ